MQVTICIIAFYQYRHFHCCRHHYQCHPFHFLNHLDQKHTSLQLKFKLKETRCSGTLQQISCDCNKNQYWLEWHKNVSVYQNSWFFLDIFMPLKQNYYKSMF